MNLKLAFEKRALREGETVRALFEKVRGPHAFLLESGQPAAVKGEHFSYIGWDPFAVLWRVGGTVQAEFLKDFGSLKHTLRGQILGGEKEWAVTDMLGQFGIESAFSSGQDDALPFAFRGGAAGFLGYDFGAEMLGVSQKVFDDTELPDWTFGLYDRFVAVDSAKGEVYFVALGASSAEANEKVLQCVKEMEEGSSLTRKGEVSEPISNVSKETYCAKIAQIHELLERGETYQVNFSQRFCADSALDSWGVYKRLVQGNPVPFGCFFEYPDFQIMSAAPELLLRKRGRHIETWPIKGTVATAMRRSALSASSSPSHRTSLYGSGEDSSLPSTARVAAATQKLLASKKDEAELTMIVDLARNDLGKVCEIGSVKVTAHREVQQYAHLLHTVSRVEGTLLRDATVFDCIKALFPGGSITGCPKKRTVEIIDSLEDFKRGVYTGSAGFIGFDGNVDLNILIRTAVQKDGRLYYHAGGGIVVDSEAAAEYEESLLKAQGFFEAVGG